MYCLPICCLLLISECAMCLVHVVTVSPWKSGANDNIAAFVVWSDCVFEQYVQFYMWASANSSIFYVTGAEFLHLFDDLVASEHRIRGICCCCVCIWRSIWFPLLQVVIGSPSISSLGVRSQHRSINFKSKLNQYFTHSAGGGLKTDLFLGLPGRVDLLVVVPEVLPGCCAARVELKFEVVIKAKSLSH